MRKVDKLFQLTNIIRARQPITTEALAAAKAFENGDERFQPYMAAIEELKFMGHFKP